MTTLEQYYKKREEHRQRVLDDAVRNYEDALRNPVVKLALKVVIETPIIEQLQHHSVHPCARWDHTAWTDRWYATDVHNWYYVKTGDTEGLAGLRIDLQRLITPGLKYAAAKSHAKSLRNTYYMRGCVCWAYDGFNNAVLKPISEVHESELPKPFLIYVENFEAVQAYNKKRDEIINRPGLGEMPLDKRVSNSETQRLLVEWQAENKAIEKIIAVWEKIEGYVIHHWKAHVFARLEALFEALSEGKSEEEAFEYASAQPAPDLELRVELDEFRVADKFADSLKNT